MVGFLISTGPLLITLGGHFIKGEEDVSPARLGAITLWFLEVIVLMYKGSTQLGRTSLLAQLAVVLASACYVVGNLIARCLNMVAP